MLCLLQETTKSRLSLEAIELAILSISELLNAKQTGTAPTPLTASNESVTNGIELSDALASSPLHGWVMATLKAFPQLICTNAVPAGGATSTGWVTSSASPSPNSPEVLTPQAKHLPEMELNAKQWATPQAQCVMDLSSSEAIRMGC